MPKVMSNGKVVKEFPYTPAGEQAAKKMAAELGGKVSYERAHTSFDRIRKGLRVSEEQREKDKEKAKA